LAHFTLVALWLESPVLIMQALCPLNLHRRKRFTRG